MLVPFFELIYCQSLLFPKSSIVLLHMQSQLHYVECKRHRSRNASIRDQFLEGPERGKYKRRRFVLVWYVSDAVCMFHISSWNMQSLLNSTLVSDALLKTAESSGSKHWYLWSRWSHYKILHSVCCLCGLQTRYSYIYFRNLAYVMNSQFSCDQARLWKELYLLMRTKWWSFTGYVYSRRILCTSIFSQLFCLDLITK